jgi:demethylsterigmatocystin 6-O-methyltransferase
MAVAATQAVQGLTAGHDSLQSSDWMNGFSLLDKEARSTRLSQPQTVETAFFVDVGGGYGHQFVQVREKYPNLHGCLVLQDLPQVVDKLPPIDGVKAMAHDFFEKQIIEGMSCPYPVTNQIISKH